MRLERSVIGTLGPDEIEDVLRACRIGRLGCIAEDRPYVVPVAYTYDGSHVYAHSADGLKIRAMRFNPSVCFEVDDVRSLVEWRSVIAWGRYEELWGAAEEDAARRLHAALAELADEASASPDRHEAERRIFFRLQLVEKTGRFERRGRP